MSETVVSIKITATSINKSLFDLHNWIINDSVTIYLIFDSFCLYETNRFDKWQFFFSEYFSLQLMLLQPGFPIDINYLLLI